MSEQLRIPSVMMRGGTSKAVFFHEGDLPGDPEARDGVLLRVFGSPDARQIDALGGSYSVTSNCVIISLGQRPGIDINYTFAQVGIAKPIVDYRGNCGNRVRVDEMDLAARIMSMQSPHPAYAVTGAIATAAASAIAGTVVSEIVASVSEAVTQVRLGHPAGTMSLEVVTAPTNAGPKLVKVIVGRTACRLMDGYAYIPQPSGHAAAPR